MIPLHGSVGALAIQAVALLSGALLTGYGAVQALLLLFAGHRWVTLWRARAGTTDDSTPAPERWPRVTVQLPIFNERRVVKRLIEAVVALDYPKELLEIQVLDDSTDETRELVRDAVERAREVDIVVLRRDSRRGYKAGALAEGLARARGELIAIFDADFVPRPDFLRRAVPLLRDPRVGMVQARWGHLNRSRSWLTAAQAVLLDAHFGLEHTARMRRGLFFNFNGSAGIWRRACIESAGGWSDATLTEDLDLSYRAQLAGWRFVYADDIEAPAELPEQIEALESQQRRWARGSIQTARRLLPQLLGSRLPRRVRLEAAFHLTANAAYPLLLALLLLFAPVLLIAPRTPALVSILMEAVVFGLGILPVCLFLIAGQRRRGRPAASIARDVAAALVLGTGLAVNISGAVVAAMRNSVGDWERTPKSGDGPGDRHATGYAPATRSGRVELALAVGFAGALALATRAGNYRALPFLALLVAGFGVVGLAPRTRVERSSATGGP